MAGRYLLFAGTQYYPSGGWYDFVGAFHELEEAKLAMPTSDAYNWAHVVDLSSGQIVEGYNLFARYDDV